MEVPADHRGDHLRLWRRRIRLGTRCSGGAPLSIAAVAYAAVTGITLYLSGHVQRRISIRRAMLLDRFAGILFTAIAATLLTNGFTGLVLNRLHR